MHILPVDNGSYMQNQDAYIIIVHMLAGHNRNYIDNYYVNDFKTIASLCCLSTATIKMYGEKIQTALYIYYSDMMKLP